MSKKTARKTELPQGSKVAVFLPRARRCGRILLRTLITRRVVVSLLVVTVAAELAVLGVGVTRRLDLAYERSLEASRAQLAVI